jgi:hypothetical protein
MSIAAIAETYATAGTCLFRNVEITKGQPKGGTRFQETLRMQVLVPLRCGAFPTHHLPDGIDRSH